MTQRVLPMSAVSQAVRHFIGGSDAAVAANLSRYKSPLRLWQELTGEVEREDLSDNQAVHFGKILEDPIAVEFARRTKLKVMRDPREFTHAKFSFLVGHIDRRIVGMREGLECKTASLRMAREWGEEGTDSVPMEYLAQCAHYLAVTGWVRWHVALLLAGNDFRIYTIERDEELINELTAAECRFWKCVTDRTPPAPTTIDDVKHLWPKDSGETVTADEVTGAAVVRLKELRAQVKAAETECEHLEVSVKAAMKDATTLLGPNGKPICTWKAQETKRIDVAALREQQPAIAAQFERVSQTRVFRIK